MSADPITVAIFVAVIAVTLGITAWAGRRNRTASSHYVAGGQITGWQNGLAIVGDLLSASTFLGVAGLLALQGVYGFYLLAGGLVAFLLVLLLVAEPLRNLGRFTVADVLSSRFRSRGVRAVMAVNTLIVTIFYMIAQLVGAGVLISLLVGIPYWTAVSVVGVLMAVYITVGGMLATTWIQIVKAVMLLAAMAFLVVLTLARFDFDVVAMFTAVEASAANDLFSRASGLLPGLELVSVAVAQVLGTAALPHILIRFFTVPDAQVARKSMSVALWVLGLAFLAMPFIGYGAAALVGQVQVRAANSAGNLAAPQLAELLGGPVLFAVIAAVAFATILAVVAGLVIAGSGAVAHDLYSSLWRKGRATDAEQVRAGRIAAIGIALVSIVLALGAQNTNIALLALMAVVVAASANVPVLVLLLFWPRLTTRGAITGITAGLISSVVLVLVGPGVMGDAALFPLSYPTLVSVPLGFLGCYLGTRFSGPRPPTEAPFDDMHVQATTGRTLV
ncbi:solute symporter family protein [Actinomycetospora termitidis]|uniref:Cation acetate symporter n=1 Tax=Actinomycetospora termitidis TaxID=3053470 RepID=A0ABT7MFC0_9PSEU|nr:cation acetate symporter [Actinomycetospora sp. Odt1-22]MDL5158879.1 cation acetate symporter [Actinomycetospora sp. Odt1-22]